MQKVNPCAQKNDVLKRYLHCARYRTTPDDAVLCRLCRLVSSDVVRSVNCEHRFSPQKAQVWI